MLQLKDEAAELLDKNGIEYIMLRPTSIFGTRTDGIKDRNMHIFGRFVSQLPLFPIFAKGKATGNRYGAETLGKPYFFACATSMNLRGKG